MVAFSWQKPGNGARIAIERHSQWLVTAFIGSGMLFMLLPGTFLGVWNLIDISEQHTLASLSSAWFQAHGQAQIFGWIGSFILGVGFYSPTKMQSTHTFPVRAGWTAWTLWTLGNTFRWIAGVTGWHWRVQLPPSAILDLAAFTLFYRSVRRHSPQSAGHGKEAWMLIVFGGTIAFLIAMIANFVSFSRVAIFGDTPTLPHLLDQQLIVLAVWGVLVPTVWGFNARWPPVFGGFKKPDNARLLVAYSLSIAGVFAVFFQWWAVSAAFLLIAALLAIDALHVWAPAVQPAKLLNVNSSFPLFLWIPYVWLAVSCVLNALAVLYDHAGGVWGASRHAITVGFIAGMVFVVRQRVLPAFCGMRIRWSTRLMLWSLLLLQIGCACALWQSKIRRVRLDEFLHRHAPI